MKMIQEKGGHVVAIIDHIEQKSINQYADLIEIAEKAGRTWYLTPDNIVQGDYPAYRMPEWR